MKDTSKKSKEPTKPSKEGSKPAPEPKAAEEKESEKADSGDRINQIEARKA